MDATAALRRTPLHQAHVDAGARLVEFAGWEMPVSYEGVRPEHLAVRSACGVFDVSHMGEIETAGPAAGELLQRSDAWDAGVPRERYLRRCDLKTARLFKAACELGALQTGAPVGPLGEFGRRIGLAFQLLDDVLEARRSFELVAQDFDDQHQDHGASQSDETELDAQHLAHRHRQHGQQEHSHRDEGEQPVRDVGLDAGGHARVLHFYGQVVAILAGKVHLADAGRLPRRGLKLVEYLER